MNINNILPIIGLWLLCFVLFCAWVRSKQYYMLLDYYPKSTTWINKSRLHHKPYFVKGYKTFRVCVLAVRGSMVFVNVLEEVTKD